MPPMAETGIAALRRTVRHLRRGRPAAPKWRIAGSGTGRVPWMPYPVFDEPVGVIAPNPVTDDKLTTGEITGGQTTDGSRAMVLGFAFVIAKVARCVNTLSVLDFGGGLGGYYRIARNAVPDLKITYTVQELPDLCAIGRQARPDVRFVSSSADLERSYDLVVASSSLQYAEDWCGQFADLARHASPWLFVTRVMIFEDETRLLAERVPSGEATVWAFGRSEFLAVGASAGLCLVDEFAFQDSFDDIEGTSEKPTIRGFLFRRA